MPSGLDVRFTREPSLPVTGALVSAAGVGALVSAADAGALVSAADAVRLGC